MGFRSRLSGGVLSQFTPSLKNLTTQGDMFGVVILHEAVPTQVRSCRNVCWRIFTQLPESRIPLKTHIPVLPRRLIPAQTWTFAGCFGL